MLSGPHPLEPDADEMERLGVTAVRELVGFIGSLQGAPASDLEDDQELFSRLSEAPPERGRPPEDVLPLVLDASRKAVDTANPGFLAYIPGGGLYTAAIAALLGFGTNRFVPIAEVSPGYARIEASVVRWMADLFDLPAEARGVLTSGGSAANLAALVTAREAHDGDAVGRGTIYVSAYAHHSVDKAARVAGIAADRVRVVSCDEELKMQPDVMASMIDHDRDAGLEPFLIVGTAGTTDTGAVDPLDALAHIAGREGLWFHVDGAYGGFFQLTERGRRRLGGIVRADSISLDPHKGLFVPYGTGCLLVRSGKLLRDAHAGRGRYMQDQGADEDPDVPSFADYGPELSRDFRGLRVWLPLQLHGVAAFRDALDEKLDLARVVYEALAGAEGFEVPWQPELSTVAFRYLPRDGDPDDFNLRLLERINASKRIFLSSTRVGGRYLLRVSVLSHRTHEDRIREAIEIITRSVGEVEE